MQKEIWKDIIGFEGLYSVSSMGRIKSLKRLVNSGYGALRTVRERFLKFGKKRPYPLATLHKKTGNKSFNVHVLVALYFVPNPEKKPCVNHKNGNKYDPRAANLEWCTYKENSNHAINTLGSFHFGNKNMKNFQPEWEKEKTVNGHTIRSANDKLIASKLKVGLTYIDAVLLGVGERAFRACLYRFRKSGVKLKTELVKGGSRRILKYTLPKNKSD